MTEKNLFRKISFFCHFLANKAKFYLRYVDDILAAFDNEQDSLNFLHFLNKKHPNSKFTIEKQLTILSLLLMYSLQVSIIKISPFSRISQTNLYRLSLKF